MTTLTLVSIDNVYDSADVVISFEVVKKGWLITRRREHHARGRGNGPWSYVRPKNGRCPPWLETWLTDRFYEWWARLA